MRQSSMPAGGILSPGGQSVSRTKTTMRLLFQYVLPLLVRLALSLVAAALCGLGTYQRLLAFETEPQTGQSPWGWVWAPPTPARQGAIMIAIMALPLWWIFFAQLKELRLRWQIQREDPLARVRGREEAIKNIQTIITKATLDADHRRLAAVAAPAGYADKLLDRTEKWLADLTLLTRGNFGITVGGMRVATSPQQVRQIAQTQALAEDVSDAQATLEADAELLSNPSQHNLNEHPTVQLLRQAQRAADTLAKKIPAYTYTFKQVKQIIERALKRTQPPVNTVAQAVTLLKQWDEDATQLSLTLDSIGQGDRFLKRGWDETTNMLALRPELAQLQQVAQSRAMRGMEITATETPPGDAEQLAVGNEHAGALANPNDKTQTSSNRKRTQERTEKQRQLTRLRYLNNQRQPWAVEIITTVNPTVMLTLISVALLSAATVIWLGISGPTPRTQVLTTVLLAAITAAATLICLPIVGVHLRTKRQQRRELDPHAINEQMKPTMTALVMCEDLISLAVNATEAHDDKYGPALKRRYGHYLHDRDELLRLTNFTGRETVVHQPQRGTQIPTDPTQNPLDLNSYLALMGLVQAELDGIWRALDILAGKPGWQQQWHAECDSIAELSRDRIRIGDDEGLTDLREELLQGKIPAWEALATLDLLAEDYRLLRRVRGLTNNETNSQTPTKLIEDLTVACQHRQTLTLITQLSAVTTSYPTALDSGNSLTRPARYDTVDRSTILFIFGFYPFWVILWCIYFESTL